MSYDCADFQQTVFGMFQDAGLIPKNADPEGPSETADLVTTAFEKLKQQRDDMRAALEAILFQVVQGKVLERDACITQARAALAKAKGAA